MRSNCPPSRKFTFLWPHSHTHSLQLFPPTLQLFLTVFKKQRERERERNVLLLLLLLLLRWAGWWLVSLLQHFSSLDAWEAGSGSGRKAHRGEGEASSPCPPAHV